jgi:hypothetical protein
VATDSFAVRHHTAEALVRLYHGLTVGSTAGGSAACVWASVADGPVRTVDLVEQASSHLRSTPGREAFWSLVLPSAVAPEATQEMVTALNIMGAWLQRAMALLIRDDININAAHNKVKHGLAVRPRDDVRITFTTQGPNADGTIPVSALTGPDAVDLFDTVTLDYLARPSKQHGRRQGLEVSTLRLSPEVLLAEAWMMAVTHGAMFYVAAAQHFAGREGLLATYPRLPLGPTPDQLLGNSIVGMRFPVTTPPDGRALDREAGIALQKHFVPLHIDFANATVSTVVDG